MEVTDPVNNSTPPVTPMGLTVDGAFDGMIGISWNPNYESNISGYNIFRSTESGDNFNFVRFTSNNYFDDIGLDYDSTYFYKISAVNKAGLQSGLSDFVSAKPTNIYAPIPPLTININARNLDESLEIFLSWSPSLDKDVALYEIYRDTVQFQAADANKLIARTDKTNFTDTHNLSPGTNYIYGISAVDKGNFRGPLSNVISDYILEKPLLIFPADNSEINELIEFRITTVQNEAQYKLLIQSSQVGGIIEEINFYAEEPSKEKIISAKGLHLESYKTYFWRVMTFTNNNTEPNSYSKLFSFYYNPK